MKKVSQFIDLVINNNINGSHQCGIKAEFHRQGRSLLRAIAKRLGISADIRSCYGGPAVSGEVILHGDDLYICLLKSVCGVERLYFRSCNGKKDFVGGQNQWMRWEELLDLDQACKRFEGERHATSQET
jgi:hypothetical protein